MSNEKKYRYKPLFTAWQENNQMIVRNASGEKVMPLEYFERDYEPVEESISPESMCGDYIMEARDEIKKHLGISATFFDDCITKVILRVKQAEGNGWKTIESAPKDGTDILLYVEDGVIQAKWHLEGNQWETIYLSSHGCGCCGVKNEEPTHWRELPAPPKLTKT